MRELSLPDPSDSNKKVSIQASRTVVIVGANGAGKSKLGMWLDENMGTSCFRITAQRAISMPSHIRPLAYDRAEHTLLFGNYEEQWSKETHERQRLKTRYVGEAIDQLNDFEKLLTTLFAESTRRDRIYTQNAFDKIPSDYPEKSRLEKLKEIWEDVLPHRFLHIGDDKVEAGMSRDTSYGGRYMSDGERVAVYLIGQALCAPKDSVIVIDEPEIHIHRAIQSRLWDSIEQARPDCLFVYITHDLDFASTRSCATKVWLESYDGARWQWQVIPDETGIPEQFLCQILGSRRSVLFVEGLRASHDASLYRALYGDVLVIPAGGGRRVIELVKSFRKIRDIHSVKTGGIVDRDRRGREEVDAIEAAGVCVLKVSEVENLYCVPLVIEAVAEQLSCSWEAKRAIEVIADRLRSVADSEAVRRAVAKLQFKLSGFSPQKSSGVDSIESEFEDYVSGIQLKEIVAEEKKELSEARSPLTALKYLNDKGVLDTVSNVLGVKKSRYIGIVNKNISANGADVWQRARTAMLAAIGEVSFE